MPEPMTKERLGRFLRITVCLLSFGFVFPYALMESVEAERLAAKELLEAAKASDKPGSDS
jgi:hypothetical protein